MKNKKDYFEVNCAINHGGYLKLKLPYTVHGDFERTVSSGDEKLMVRLVELFGEYELLGYAKRQVYQALILQKADQISTIDDLLTCLKAVRLCTTLCGND